MSDPLPGSQRLRERLSGWLPAQSPVSLTERLIAAAAAFVAILLLAAISAYFLAAGPAPFLVASMGASAVLLFAAPHSPLAHPWSLAGGHLLSALAGAACAWLIPNPYAAGAAAVALALLFMHTGRCLHPPGGATALLPVIGGEVVRSAGFGYVLAPVGANVLVLLVLALVLNNLIPGRRWPWRPPAAARTAAPEWLLGRLGLKREDLEAALREMDAYIDVSEEDLEQIYAKATLRAYRRRLGEVRCEDIMSREVVTAEYGDEIEALWARMQRAKVKGVPVVDRAQRVIGIVTIMDFVKQAGPCEPQHFFERLCRAIRRTPGLSAQKPEVVGQIMSQPAITARADAHVVTLVPLFAQHNIHHVPVVDAENRLTGIVTQSDLVGALYAAKVAVN